MKKNYYCILFLLLFSSMSCKKSLLDVKNNNTISTGNFWETEKQAEAAVTSVYNMFYRQGTWTRNIYTQMNGMADDGVSYAGWTELAEYTRFIYTDYNFSDVNVKIWREHYIAIFRANQVLDHIGDIPFKSEAHKEDIIGQVEFLRSFYYFYLTVLWGDIPLVLHVSSPGDQPKGVTPNEVFAQLEIDLKDAIKKLPPKRDAEDYGRPTKGAAYALLGKIYMQQHKWKDAIDCFKWLVDGDGAKYYGLMDDYGDNFNDKTENNKESVFEIQFSLINKVGFDQTDNYLDPNAELGTQIEMNQAPPGIGWNNIEARRWLVDYYKREKTTDGKYDSRLFYSLWYDNESKDFPNRSDSLIYDQPWDLSWGKRVFIKKYHTDVVPIYFWNDNNFRVIRYSDILLLYAEAVNEVNGPTTKAVGLLNRVRERAHLPDIQNSTYYDGTKITSNKDAFREHIKIERALELSCECVRWIDLKRWGLTDQSTINKLKKRDDDFNNFVIAKSDRMPIPQSEVDNNSNLDQNPKY